MISGWLLFYFVFAVDFSTAFAKAPPILPQPIKPTFIFFIISPHLAISLSACAHVINDYNGDNDHENNG